MSSNPTHESFISHQFRPFQTVFHSSSDVKGLFVQNIDANPSSSKRKIQKAATDEIGGLFDVICSSHDFSYLANTQVCVEFFYSSGYSCDSALTSFSFSCSVRPATTT